jgi:uncharacterized membrane protein YfcA
MGELIPELLTFRFLFALIIGFAGGLMQGYTGWGGAMLMMPLMTLVYPPVEALAMLTVGGLLISAQLLPATIKYFNWRSMRGLLFTLVLLTPIGSIMLLHVEPSLVRKIIGGVLVLISILVLSGWEYKGKRGRLSTIFFGGVGGIVNGFSGLGSPILAIYIMAFPGQAKTQRSNLIIATGLIIFTILIIFSLNGIMEWNLVVMGILLAPTQMAGASFGARIFACAPQEYFKKITLMIILILGSAVIIFS